MNKPALLRHEVRLAAVNSEHTENKSHAATNGFKGRTFLSCLSHIALYLEDPVNRMLMTLPQRKINNI
jgi:hypothetical protein